MASAAAFGILIQSLFPPACTKAGRVVPLARQPQNLPCSSWARLVAAPLPRRYPGDDPIWTTCWAGAHPLQRPAQILPCASTGMRTVSEDQMGKMRKRTRSIAKLAMEAINAGFNSVDAAAWVRLIEPTARTTPRCIDWYRWDMRRRGL